MSESPAADLATLLVDQLAAAGLRHAVVCPGSRSAPVAMALARHPRISTLIQIDERSAGFFALGLAKQLEAAVALVCTSGTAAAEFHPAVVEAYHSRTPLLVMTADRPPELRDVGAPQAIDQTRLFGTAVRWSFDPGPPDPSPEGRRSWRRLALRALAEAVGPPAGPVHLNLPFREPLVSTTVDQTGPGSDRPDRVVPGRADPDQATVLELAEALAAAERPLIVAGAIRRGAELVGPVGAVLAATGTVLLAEPTSQLRTSGVQPQVDCYDLLLREGSSGQLPRPDLVLRVGAPPTSRSLGRFLADSPAPLILVDPDSPFADPDAMATEIVRADPAALLSAVAGELGPPGSEGRDWRRDWARAATLASRAVDSALASLPLFEAHAVTALARLLDSGTLWVGSSMPIRDLDSFWPGSDRGPQFLANRGANGIDGFVSTIMGGAVSGRPTTGLLGDLTLFHDLNGLWSARRHGLDVRLVLLDNNGGGIFSFLPQAAHTEVFEELFGTPLDFDLVAAARLHGFRTVEAGSSDELQPALAELFREPGPALLRVAFSRRDSLLGHQACWQAVAAALGSG